jgi:hypothetical protein
MSMIHNLTVYVKVAGKNKASCEAPNKTCDFSYTPPPWDGNF